MDIPPDLLAAANAAEPALTALPGVVAVGVGLREENGQIFTDQLAVRVLVKDAAAVPAGIPETIGGVSVCIVEANFQPCSNGLPDTKRYAQIAGGIRIECLLTGNGTLGCVVKDANTGELLGLSCYHVAGDPNNSFPNTIWQPTPPPGASVVGSPVPRNDNIGNVIRVDFPQTQTPEISPRLVGVVDAAVISLAEARNQGRSFSPAILGQNDQQPNLVNQVTSTARPNPGDFVRKRGAVTGVTSGICLGLYNKGVPWTPPGGPPNAWLIDQFEILASPDPSSIFAQSGDSGALVLLQDAPTAVGLLWGANSAGNRATMCAIPNVESRLGVKVVW
jgi:hypothetical protein